MTWMAKDYGCKVGSIEFSLATDVADDGEGGSAAGVSPLVIPVRLKLITQGSDRARLEQVFPGTNTQQFLFNGWVGHSKDHRVYTFPKSLRGWHEPPTGKFTYRQGRDTYSGAIEVSVQLFPDDMSAARIGERFSARFTLD